GCLGYELDLNLLSPVEKKEVKKQVAYYKKYRRTFQYGRFYRINEEELYESFEVRGEKTIVSKFRRLVHAAPIYDKLYAFGLNDDAMYEIVSRPYLHTIRQFGHLINFVLPVKIDANGHIMNEIGKRKGMDAAGQNYRASGAALRSGIYLNNLFLGSGFNDKLRIPLDYGSDMYEIKEIKQ
ncbi:MAG: alpha-galactosidase, partial [Erysipelotrichaceae bacterium]|nr:alpha-galactosidase [Erysipelotrichaceae bacterium]